MAAREILLLGNPTLLQRSEPVNQTELESIRVLVDDLHDTLIDFRANHGVGRAIAAPQIGVLKRVVYMNIKHPVTFINPVLTDCSEEMMELWDDCMSFPDLLVKVRRYRSCTIHYRDLSWSKRSLFLNDDMSELLQHECDHLDGVLAVARAIDGSSFSYRQQLNPDSPV